MMNKFTSLAVFLLIVLAASAISGQFVGGHWYQSMNQPGWNPPAVVMALVWGVLYVSMAVSAWLVWENRHGAAMVALGWWVFQLLLGIGWSFLYFGLERVGWCLALTGIWLIAVLVVINAFRRINATASVLMVPVAAWLAFAWVLNFVQWRLNGGLSF